jgi:CheY-like chemotaxis protein
MSADTPTRVLVVDDESHIVHVVRLKLSNAGYDVLSAADGEEGYESACKHRPDLIITDYQMPYMTGLEMCRRLRQNPDTENIPVLMLSARGYALEDEELRSVNIVATLGKPFSPRELLTRVVEVLGASAA